MRGKPVKARKFKRGTRITPAGAGKTVPQAMGWAVSQDHPRRCGENFLFRKRYMLSRGSPPQVRGKLVTADFDAAMDGITPAGAGKTS